VRPAFLPVIHCGEGGKGKKKERLDKKGKGKKNASACASPILLFFYPLLSAQKKPKTERAPRPKKKKNENETPRRNAPQGTRRGREGRAHMRKHHLSFFLLISRHARMPGCAWKREEEGFVPLSSQAGPLLRGREGGSGGGGGGESSPRTSRFGNLTSTRPRKGKRGKKERASSLLASTEWRRAHLRGRWGKEERKTKPKKKKKRGKKERKGHFRNGQPTNIIFLLIWPI